MMMSPDPNLRGTQGQLRKHVPNPLEKKLIPPPVPAHESTTVSIMPMVPSTHVTTNNTINPKVLLTPSLWHQLITKDIMGKIRRGDDLNTLRHAYLEAFPRTFGDGRNTDLLEQILSYFKDMAEQMISMETDAIRSLDSSKSKEESKESHIRAAPRFHASCQFIQRNAEQCCRRVEMDQGLIPSSLFVSGTATWTRVGALPQPFRLGLAKSSGVTVQDLCRHVLGDSQGGIVLSPRAARPWDPVLPNTSYVLRDASASQVFRLTVEWKETASMRRAMGNAQDGIQLSMNALSECVERKRAPCHSAKGFVPGGIAKAWMSSDSTVISGPHKKIHSKYLR